jgi:hypothetical protein
MAPNMSFPSRDLCNVTERVPRNRESGESTPEKPIFESTA